MLTFWNRLRRTTRSTSTPSPFGETPERRGLVITVCFLISVLIWFSFTMQERYPNELEMPVRVVNLPPDQALRSLPPDRVRLRVEAEGFQLLRLRYNPPSLMLDASRPEINLAEQARMQLPNDVRIEAVTPQAVTLVTEPRLQRRIPIALRAHLEPPPSYVLLETYIDPDSVTISGAESLVRDLTTWPTVRVVRSGVMDTLRMTVPLSDTLAPLIERSPESTLLTAIALPFTGAERRLPVQIEGAPTSEQIVDLEQNTVLVQYSVLLSDYEASLTSDEFEVTVSYDQIRSDTTGRVTPQVHLPPGLSIRNVRVIPPTLGYYNVLIEN